MAEAYPLNEGSVLVDAVNYLLSGPGGTGQNFSGLSSIELNYIRPSTGNPPNIRPILSNYNNNIVYAKGISNAVIVGSNPTKEVTFTFSTPFTNVPFQYGDAFVVTGLNPAAYNGQWTVFSCTTTTVTCYRDTAATYPAFISSSGGLVRDLDRKSVV